MPTTDWSVVIIVLVIALGSWIIYGGEIIGGALVFLVAACSSRFTSTPSWHDQRSELTILALPRSRALAQGTSPHVAETLSRHLVAGELAGFRAELPAGVTATIYEKGIDAYAGGHELCHYRARIHHPFGCVALREPAKPSAIQPCMLVDCRHPV